MKKQQVAIQKPALAAALSFAKDAPKSIPEPVLQVGARVDTPKAKKTPQAASKKAVTSGLVPAGDIRLTANISIEHHRKLKIAAIERGLTVGELIEKMTDEL